MIERLDQLVLTVTIGMRHQVFGGGRSALVFVPKTFNLYLQDQEFKPQG